MQHFPVISLLGELSGHKLWCWRDAAPVTAAIKTRVGSTPPDLHPASYSSSLKSLSSSSKLASSLSSALDSTTYATFLAAALCRLTGAGDSSTTSTCESYQAELWSRG